MPRPSISARRDRYEAGPPGTASTCASGYCASAARPSTEWPCRSRPCLSGVSSMKPIRRIRAAEAGERLEAVAVVREDQQRLGFAARRRFIGRHRASQCAGEVQGLGARRSDRADGLRDLLGLRFGQLGEHRQRQHLVRPPARNAGTAPARSRARRTPAADGPASGSGCRSGCPAPAARPARPARSAVRTA